jgi:polyisoprenoid-binding protein YceI
MIMKTLLALSLALSAGAFAQNTPQAVETFKVDPAATKIEWVGKKVTGEHRGAVKVKEGSTIQASGDVITGGTIIVDINSMSVTDITDTETANKFLGHMKSADFFNTEKYPEARLEITTAKKSKNGLAIEGKLTMIGSTQPVKFTATNVTRTGDTLSAKALINVDRTKHGLKYGSGQFFKGLGDKMINDEFTLNIEFSAKK